MAKFKITNIAPDGIVTVDLNVGTKTITRRMQGIPLDSAESVKDFFSAYLNAYQAGKALETKPTIPADVTALVGVDTTIEAKVK